MLKNYDTVLFDKRQQKYKRAETFHKMVIKHLSGNCLCKKQNKECLSSYIDNGKLNINKFSSQNYLDKKIGLLEAIYSLCSSITNSMRSCSGRDFENCVEEIFIETNKHYDKQVYVTIDGNIVGKKKPTGRCHKIDFISPIPTYPCTIENFYRNNGLVISCKTTLRERKLQDSIYHGKGFYCITLDKDKIESSSTCNYIVVNPTTKSFTYFLKVLTENQK